MDAAAQMEDQSDAKATQRSGIEYVPNGIWGFIDKYDI